MKTYATIILVLLLVPAGALGDDIEGTIHGFHAVTSRNIEPVDHRDPMLAYEQVFVISAEDGGFYFITNLNRSFLVDYASRQVRITGELDRKYRTIRARTFEVLERGTRKMRWSREKELEDALKALPTQMIENLG